MKRFFLPVLMVLLLSLVLFGCSKDPCEVCGEEPCICKGAAASNLSKEAKDQLTTMGEDPNTFPTPLGTTFLDYEYVEAIKTINIVWKDANKSMFDYYKDAWSARAVSVTDNTSFTNASIEFYTSAGNTDPDDGEGVAYPAGSIVFSGKSGQ